MTPPKTVALLALGLAVTALAAAAIPDRSELQERRRRAAVTFADGILLLHSNSAPQWAADGFRQDPAFYYFTGLDNTVGALLAIDGRTNHSWLFLPPKQTGVRAIEMEVSTGSEEANRLGIERIASWMELEGFLSNAGTATLYYAAPEYGLPDLPPNLAAPGRKANNEPSWVSLLLAAKGIAVQPKDATERVQALMAVQSPSEQSNLRAAAKSTVAAFQAGLAAIRPNTTSRLVEAAVEDGCWRAGAHGAAFWPWAMSGANGVFPRPMASLTRYDHLNAELRSGDLVRLDVGCEWEHYGGDFGRTVPVSGRYSKEQREIWNIFVDAYQAAVRVLRDGVTVDQVYEAWRTELLRHRNTASGTTAAQRAIDSWSKRENVPYWELHTSNLTAGDIPGALRAGMTINFEPIASIDGQGYYLEDMFLITSQGAELLTPGVPYTAEALEAAMRSTGRKRQH